MLTWPLLEMVGYYVSKEPVRKLRKVIKKISKDSACSYVFTTSTMQVKVAYELSMKNASLHLCVMRTLLGLARP